MQAVCPSVPHLAGEDYFHTAHAAAVEVLAVARNPKASVDEVADALVGLWREPYSATGKHRRYPKKTDLYACQAKALMRSAARVKTSDEPPIST